MKSFLKFLSRNKLYTAIEFVGLAVSLAFVILIGSYVVQQYKVAHESPDWKRTFALGRPEAIGLSYWDKEELELGIPEIENVTHACLMWQPAIQITDEEEYKGSGMQTDAEFFDVFPQYRIIEGSAKDFVSKTDVLISQSLARRIANQPLVGGKILINKKEVTIKGIFKDFDQTFFMPVDVITHISDNYAVQQGKNFGGIGAVATWYKVRPDADLGQVEAKVKALLHRNYDNNWSAERVEQWGSYRMDKAFFHKSNGLTRMGSLQMLRLLTIVVLLLLLSAIFNYVNLNLALTGKRSKEMATRRLLGADKKDILRNSILESISFTAICFAAALLLAYLLTPMMNGLVSSRDARMAATGLREMTVRISFMLTPGYIAAYIAGILLLGTIAGLLPAFAASRYEPIDVIKGTFRRRTKMVLSKIFIIIQNVITVFLISMALILGVQMRHMLSRPTHSAVDNRFYLEFKARDDNMAKLLKDKIEALSCVSEVGVGVGLPGTMFATLGINSDEEHQIDMPVILCDTTYFRLLGMEILEDFGHPLGNSVWMSESAFNAANVSDTSTVFARRINFNNVTPDYIGGIVHDFPTDKASQSEINPNGAIIVGKDNLMYASCMLIGTIGEDKSYEDQIVKAYGEYTREQFGVEQTSWVYGFIKDINRKQLEPERRTLRLLELFAVLAVLISMLGLLAMSTYFADENTKQIAVRKVFGSDVARETWRTVRSYMMLVGVACIIGIPLAIWAARLYLQRFAYRIEGYGWVFVVGAVIALVISFLAVLWQTLRAARTNPATELKKE